MEMIISNFKKLTQKGVYFLLFSALLFLSSCESCSKKGTSSTFFAPPSTKDAFALLYTASVQGYVEPCGCNSNPLGGIARLASVVKNARATYNQRVFFVDAGDLLFESTNTRNAADMCYDQVRIDLLLGTLQKLGLQSTLFGPYDAAMGKEWRDRQLQRFSLLSLDASPFALKILEIQGLKIGLLTLGERFEIQDNKIVTELNSVAEHLRTRGAQVVVALSQKRRLENLQIGAKLTDVDIIIQGHDPGEAPSSPEKTAANGPWLVAAGMQGQYLGVLEFFNMQERKEGQSLIIDDRQSLLDQRIALLTLRINTLQKELAKNFDEDRQAFIKQRLQVSEEEQRQISQQKINKPLDGPYFVARSIALSREVTPDPIFDADLKAYEQNLPKLTDQCEKNIECPPLAPKQAHYVGVEQCKNCHTAAYDFWQKAVVKLSAKDDDGKQISRDVGHSIAWATLEKIDKIKDRSCIGCHSVGFMQPGGYCKVDDVKIFKNVQCESCHGAGSEHVKTGSKEFIRREVPESTCRSCHHVPHIETTASFNYDEQLQRILGPGHGEALLKKLSHKK